MKIRLHKCEGHVPEEEKIIQKADALADTDSNAAIIK